MISQASIKKETEFYQSLKRTLKRKLRHLPEGVLYFKTEHGLKRPYIKAEGKLKYLNRKQLPLIEQLAYKKEVENALLAIDQNLDCLGWLQRDFVDFDVIMPDELCLDDISGRYLPKPRHELAAKTDSWIKCHESTQKKINHARRGHPAKQHLTSDGTYVKSKSELLLYEFFKSKGIAFKYEEPICIDGNTWYPDFSIIRPSDGRLIIWEHLGMMQHEAYLNQAIEKVHSFATNNFWPFKNLILTYDFGDGEMDMTEIERILVMMQLIP